jgi:CRISPR-associated endonuclease/helicase Cas3
MIPRFWSKTDWFNSKDSLRQATYLPFADHPLDTAAVARFITQVDRPLRRMLQTCAGMDLTNDEVDAVCFAVGHHDIGKAAFPFVGKQFPVIHQVVAQKIYDQTPPRGRSKMTGWGDPTRSRKYNRGTVLEHHTYSGSFLAKEPKGHPLEMRIREVLLPDLSPQAAQGFRRSMAAVMAHHGHPIESYQFTPAFWEKIEVEGVTLDPVAAVEDLNQRLMALIGTTQDRLREGFERMAGWPAEAFHLLSGITILCDWMTSDWSAFPIIDRHRKAEERERCVAKVLNKSALGREAPVVANPHEIGARLASMFPNDAKFQGFKLRGAQEGVLNCPLPKPGDVLCLEEETGQGKTLSATLLWARLAREGLVSGLTFLVPSRAAAKKLFTDDISQFTKALRPATNPVLAIPGYLDTPAPTLPTPDEHLFPADEVRNDPEEWARSMRHLAFAGLVSVGTVDQLLLAALPTKFGHLRSTCVAPNLLVVDEVHASDAYMTVLLNEVIRRHSAMGGITLLMSATLGDEARRILLGWGDDNPLTTAYPMLSSSTARGAICALEADERRDQKTFKLNFASSDDAAALAAQEALKGRRVLVIRNSVSAAIKTIKELIAMEKSGILPVGTVFAPMGIATAHHSRYAPADRLLLDEELVDYLKPGEVPKARIVVSTQTAEQSLDIDADVGISDLCPMDYMFQRMGRIWRRVSARRADGVERPLGLEQPEFTILVPDLTLLGTFRGRGHEVLNVGNIGPDGAYDALASAATLAALTREARLHGGISVPKDCRRLVEEAVGIRFAQSLVAEHFSQELAGRFVAWRQAAMAIKQEVAKVNVYEWSAFLDEAEAARPYDWMYDTERTVNRIATRLGLNDFQISLMPGATSPWGNAVKELNIPGHMVRDPSHHSDQALSWEPLPDGGFEFSFAGDRWTYDRFGLNKHRLS